MFCTWYTIAISYIEKNYISCTRLTQKERHQIRTNNVYIYTVLFSLYCVVFHSADRIEYRKRQSAKTTHFQNITKPLVILLQNQFRLHIRVVLQISDCTNHQIRSTTRDFTFSIQSYFIIHDFNHVNMDWHQVLLRGLSLYITHINTT
jgi:hypothetical protein